MARGNKKQRNKRTKRAGQPQDLTVPQALDLAVQYHSDGKLAEAEEIYQQILQFCPEIA